MKQPTTFGGQALMEGVMMQGGGGYAMAVRAPGGEIVYKNGVRKSIREKYAFFRLPIIRGLVSFVESMIFGFSSLTWSAVQAGEEEDEKLSWKEIALAIVLAVVLTVVFFVILPVFAASHTVEYLGHFGRSLVEGLLRIGLFLGYVLIIRRVPDVARVFEYHGAEHKTITTYEAGEKLKPENAMKYSTIHCRCGTSFILMSLIMMVVIFTFVGNTGVAGRILTKIVLMPVVLGISFEVFRLPLRFPDSKIVKALIAPGLWMQKLTTKTPDAAQLEVAMTALLCVPGFPGAKDNELPPNVMTEEEYNAKMAAKAAAKEAAAANESEEEAGQTGLTEDTEQQKQEETKEAAKKETQKETAGAAVAAAPKAAAGEH